MHTTPFAAPKSGPSQEPRVRIQNIVRQRRCLSLLLMFLLCVSLTACIAAGEETPPPSLTVNVPNQVPASSVPANPGPESGLDPVQPGSEPDPVPDPPPLLEKPLPGEETPTPSTTDIRDQLPASPVPTDPEPEPGLPAPDIPPLSETLAVLALPKGTAYVVKEPFAPNNTAALYWQNSYDTYRLDPDFSGSHYQLRPIYVLNSNCIEMTCYDVQEDGGILEESYTTTLYYLDYDFPFHLLTVYGSDIRYEDVDGDGSMDVVEPGQGAWYTRTSERDLVKIESGWEKLPNPGPISYRLDVNGFTLLAVEEAEDSTVLYWSKGGAWNELGRYPRIDGFYDGLTGEYYNPAAYILGHRVVSATHTLGGRYMIDYFTVDTPEPTFLLSAEDEATFVQDLDGDGVGELAFTSSCLWFHKRDMTPFVLVYSAGPDGRPRCADLSQLFPEWFQEEGTYIDDDNRLVHRQDEEITVLLTGPEVMAAIDTANAWSDHVLTWQELTDRTGPRDPRQ